MDLPIKERCPDPNCLDCLRKKLSAIGVAVFTRKDNDWVVADFQGERPHADAEIDFYCMLQQGVPETIAAYPSGVLLADESTITSVMGSASSLFVNRSVVAAPVASGSFSGIRLAWRDASNPFSQADLQTIQCFGICP